ncbi:MAG: FecR domain-containing protein [Burkholderiales bacterium]
MKRLLQFVVGMLAALATSNALANATAFSVSGNVSAQAGVAAARVVRQGDTLRAGETVSTGPRSSAVLRFEDGQIAALGANSRMVIQAFEYDAQAKSGNILLNLLQGGMRAVTGLIGRAQPQRVTYRAGNYTIGIRGTDVNIATDGGNAVVTVTEGLISFSFGTQTITVPAGDGVNAKSDGSFQAAAIATIVEQLQATPQGRQLLDSIQGLQSIQDAVARAAAGQAGTLTPGEGFASGFVGATPGPTGPTGAGGGGSASAR